MSGLDQKSKTAWTLSCQASDLEDEGRIASAVSVYGRASHLDDVYAQSNLGNLLDDKLKPRRSAEAVYWYKRSVRGGNGNGAWNLAIHYRNEGRGASFRYWVRVAARMGNQDALELGAKRSRSHPVLRLAAPSPFP